MDRDVPGHRRVDLRCLRASCRPLRGHLCIREAVEADRVASTRDRFQEQILVAKSRFHRASRPDFPSRRGGALVLTAASLMHR